MINQLIPVAINGGDYVIFASNLEEVDNSYIIGVIKHGAALTLLLSIEQEDEIFLYLSSQHIKWKGKTLSQFMQ